MIELLLDYDTAGDPITGLKWTRRTTSKIATLLVDSGIEVSSNTVARLLHQMGYSLRVNRKQIPTDCSPERDRQFLYISELRDRFTRQSQPIISIDTKKSELVGNFKNAGQRWGASPLPVNDHDFRSDAIGIAIPHGIYDVSANRGCITVGVSHDTAAFAVGAIARWWSQEGALLHSGARQLLVLGDTGGSNGYRHRAFKTELQSQVADSLGLAVTVAHYPTGSSKWNPIEHRLFSEISKHWAGEPLESYDKILAFIRSTTTRTGLFVSAYLDEHHYQTGIEPSSKQLANLLLEPADILPKWNYAIAPH